MKAKDKAKELVDKYQGVGIIFFGCGKEQGNPCIVGDNMPFNEAKQCALIAVDERINILAKIIELLGNDDLNAMRLINKEVKEQIKIMEEIEKL